MNRMGWLGLAALLALSGCEADDQAHLQGPAGELAAGAFADLWLVDACGGGGKINFCTTETVVAITSLTVADPRVLRLVPAAEAPPGFTSGVTHIIVQGMSPGKTTVDVEGQFNDGSTRATSATVTVARIEDVRIKPHCDADAHVLNRVLPGRTVSFDVEPRGSGKVLSGFLPDAAAGSGIACAGPAYDGRPVCSWPAPAEGGEVVVTSRLRAGAIGTLSTYAPADVAFVAVNMPGAYIAVGAPGVGGGQIPAQVLLKTGRPCQGIPVQAKTLTPAICAGPQGEAAWSAPQVGEIRFSTLGEGQCRLSLGAAGAPGYRKEIQFPLAVVTAFTAERAVNPEARCSIEGATTCMNSFRSLAACTNGVWQRTQSCPDQHVCEVNPSGVGGCTAADGCAFCR